MGKPKKRDNAVHNAANNIPEENRDDNVAMSREIEERLRRIEMAQTGGSSDVMKFVFFFFLGIMLTVLVYPRVYDAMGGNKYGRDLADISYQSKTHQDDSMVDVGDEDVGDDKEESYVLQTLAVRNKTQVAETQTTLTDYEVDNAKNIGNQDSLDETSEQFEQSIKKREDALIDEESGVIDEDNDVIIEEVSQLEKQDDIHERVELSSIDSEEIIAKAVPQPKLTKDKPELTGEATKTQAKKKKGSKKKAKSETVKLHKENVQTEMSDTTNAKNRDLPPEVKNFKATYLKKVSPKKIFADGRRIPPTELLPQKPNNSSVKVWMFEEFLSTEECDGLMRVHKQHVQDQSKEDPMLCFDSITTLRKHLTNAKKKVNVTPRDFTDGTTCVNATFSRQLKDWFKGNWSYSTAFYPGESRFASIFEQRVQQAMGLNPENGGKFQITSYPLGIGYKSHTDCMEDADKRDRVATVLVYLDTVKEGGETDFPELGIWVRPRKARALVWNNMNEEGECEKMSIHKANMVKDGHKIILQRWYYYQSFFSLGKRPPEPPLPKRSPGQPRVSCDEYEHGSCRWYDEWNFDHMIEYERQKYTLV